MAIGRPTKPLHVTPEEKEKLTTLARRPKTGQALAMRARIVLGCNDGLSNGEVAKRLRITGATVCKWRERSRVHRWKGCLMSHVPAHRDRSQTHRSRKWSPKPWSRCRSIALTGARG